jgi:hypothetical protein
MVGQLSGLMSINLGELLVQLMSEHICATLSHVSVLFWQSHNRTV